jgi:hypothetical protein
MGGSTRCNQESKSGSCVIFTSPRLPSQIFSLQYVTMSAGIIRGALSRLGLIGIVVPEINNLPQCTYGKPYTYCLCFSFHFTFFRYFPNKTAKRAVILVTAGFTLLKIFLGPLEEQSLVTWSVLSYKSWLRAGYWWCHLPARSLSELAVTVV